MKPEVRREPVFPSDVLTAVTGAEAAELARLAYGKTVLELGAYHGFSTIVLASVADRVYSVDWHMGDDHAGLGNSWDVFVENLRKYGVADRVTVCHGRFEDEVPKLAEQGARVDGAFIDGMHDEASVSRDLGLALQLVNPGGWIALHDYGRGPETGHDGFEVTQVADRFGVDHSVGFLGVCFVPEAGCELCETNWPMKCIEHDRGWTDLTVSCGMMNGFTLRTLLAGVAGNHECDPAESGKADTPGTAEEPRGQGQGGHGG